MMNQDLTTPEKCLAMCLAHARDHKTGKVRRTRKWMQGVTGMKGGTLSRALTGLVNKGVVVPTRTGRSTIYQFCAPPMEIKTGRVDCPQEVNQIDPRRSIGNPGRRLMPAGTSRKKPRYPKIRREIMTRADDGCATAEYLALPNDIEFMEAIQRDSREKRGRTGGI